MGIDSKDSTSTLDCRHNERTRLIIDDDAQTDSVPSFVHEHWRGLAMSGCAIRMNPLAVDRVVQPHLDKKLRRVFVIVERQRYGVVNMRQPCEPNDASGNTKDGELSQTPHFSVVNGRRVEQRCSHHAET